MKVGPGSVFPGPLKSAAVINGILESADQYLQQERLGDGGGRRHFGPSTDVIKVRNDSGAARRLGEVLEVNRTSGLLTDIRPDALWFKGVTPDTTRAFGILRHPVRSNDIEELQVSGVCKALVNFSDVAHTFAVVKDGSHVLDSAASGPIEIIFAQSGTGERECCVRFLGTGSGLIATATLSQRMCGLRDEEIGIENFCLVFGSGAATPATAFNRFARQGPEGMRVKLEYWLKDPSDDCASFPHWAITQVEAREFNHIVAIRWDVVRGCFVADVLRDAAVESCQDVEEIDIYCPPVCDV